ncbi:MAG: glycosyltransferase family A protein [Armatimonadota bacterium]|nr:glycosyltransferase family A protein [Armatimonadota bacterium]
MSSHVSIGMPVYNGSRYLEVAVESLLRQTYRDFDLLIADNASTDDTPRLAAHLAARDKRVRFVRNDRNIGATANFRRVFDEATGPYFKWACADDWCEPDFLEACVEVLDRRPEVVLCFGLTTEVDADGSPVAVRSDNLNLDVENAVSRFDKAAARLGTRLNALQGVMRLDALRSTRGVGDYRGWDEVLVVELAMRGRFVELQRPLLYRRFHAAAASAATTLDARLRHIDPTGRRRLSFWWWRQLSEQTRAVWAAPLPVSLKIHLCRRIARKAWWLKWGLMRELGGGLRHVLPPGLRQDGEGVG